jgi:cystathionine beta-lyase/cystathionine gamma-synthase
MERQCKSALLIAKFLENHKKVKLVNYPGLVSSSSHNRAKELLCGFGGMLSFIIEGGVEAADAFIGKLDIPISTASLGGVESLITRPVQTSHSLLSDDELEFAGIDKALIRLSVGIEAVDDLIDDMSQALDAI